MACAALYATITAHMQEKWVYDEKAGDEAKARKKKIMDLMKARLKGDFTNAKVTAHPKIE